MHNVTSEDIAVFVAESLSIVDLTKSSVRASQEKTGKKVESKDGGVPSSF